MAPTCQLFHKNKYRRIILHYQKVIHLVTQGVQGRDSPNMDFFYLDQKFTEIMAMSLDTPLFQPVARTFVFHNWNGCYLEGCCKWFGFKEEPAFIKWPLGQMSVLCQSHDSYLEHWHGFSSSAVNLLIFGQICRTWIYYCFSPINFIQSRTTETVNPIFYKFLHITLCLRDQL